ncbi:tryptophan transporter [Metabacillus arenae]|uniref:Tryptophan transporter n=1 Tax=Metabacillus arenae TaxID=2771434 RepID=A0A926NAP5_9BACI|nr:tryptophan transporter [Metabacillus arenae]MBD1380707.1 tryptophan transporter [Metabacillus arenae]
MNTKTLVSMSLFVAIGVALHAIIPPFPNGMKPDMMLTMMFLAILLFPSVKNVLLVGVATGFLSGITTSFPAGLIPNVIDKPVTAFIFFILLLAVKKYAQSVVTAGILTAIGTLISGVVFLTSALLIVGLPAGAGFTFLFLTVVLPATLLNTIAMVIIYPIVKSIAKRSNLVSAN